VVLLDEPLEVSEETNEVSNEINLSLVLSLELSQDLVGIEHSSTLHISNVGSRGGRDTNPAKSANTLSQGGQVVEELGGSVLVLNGDDFTDEIASGLQELSEDVIFGLLAFGCNLQESELSVHCLNKETSLLRENGIA